MPYIERNDDHRELINLPRFAADLAPLIGGTLLPAGDYPRERQEIKVGDDVIELYANDWKKRVRATISAPDVKWGDRNTYDKAHRTESAAVNPDGRSIEAIARDIKRRVIDPSQEPLRLQREYARQQHANRASIVERAATLKTRMPSLTVRVNEQEQNACLSDSGDRYVHAILYADGRVRIERIGNVSTEQFEQIMVVLGSPVEDGAND